MFVQGLRYMKKNLINFLKTKWWRRISRKVAGPLPVAILHLEQKTRKILNIYIYKYEVSIVGFFEISIFRKMVSTLIEKTVIYSIGPSLILASALVQNLCLKIFYVNA